VILAGDGGGPGVTDLAGNFLDGEFNGVFPSGDGDPKTPQNPTGRSASERFTQFFGFQTLAAPVVTSLQLTSQSDTGIKGDSNTSTNQPAFVGQVAASFPGTVSGADDPGRVQRAARRNARPGAGRRAAGASSATSMS